MNKKKKTKVKNTVDFREELWQSYSGNEGTLILFGNYSQNACGTKIMVLLSTTYRSYLLLLLIAIECSVLDFRRTRQIIAHTV